MSGTQFLALVGASLLFWWSGYAAGRNRMLRRWRAAERERREATIRAEREAWYEAELRARFKSNPDEGK